MAVISCTERLGQSGGSKLVHRNLLGEIKNRFFTKVYTVITDSVDDNPYTIQNSNLTPKLGQTYESDSLATVVEMRLSPQDDNFVWELEVMYDTNRIVNLIVDNPLNVPAEIKFSHKGFDFALTKDFRGVPLVTSSGNPFSEPAVTQITGDVLSITRNEAFYSTSLMRAYNGRINSVAFGEYPPFTVLSEISAERKIDNGVLYYQVNYVFTYNPFTYHCFLLDADYRDKDGRLFFDPSNGTPLSSVTLLDGTGRAKRDFKNYLRFDVDANDTEWEFFDTFEGEPRHEFPPGPSKPPHWFFNLKCGDEIVTAVGRFGPGTGVLDVVRGVGGTTAAAHSEGDLVTMEPYYLKFDDKLTANFNALGLL